MEDFSPPTVASSSDTHLRRYISSTRANLRLAQQPVFTPVAPLNRFVRSKMFASNLRSELERRNDEARIAQQARLAAQRADAAARRANKARRPLNAKKAAPKKKPVAANQSTRRQAQAKSTPVKKPNPRGVVKKTVGSVVKQQQPKNNKSRKTVSKHNVTAPSTSTASKRHGIKASKATTVATSSKKKQSVVPNARQPSNRPSHIQRVNKSGAAEKTGSVAQSSSNATKPSQSRRLSTTKNQNPENKTTGRTQEKAKPTPKERATRAPRRISSSGHSSSSSSVAAKPKVKKPARGDVLKNRNRVSSQAASLPSTSGASVVRARSSTSNGNGICPTSNPNANGEVKDTTWTTRLRGRNS